jgi:hypothetical protein
LARWPAPGNGESDWLDAPCTNYVVDVITSGGVAIWPAMLEATKDPRAQVRNILMRAFARMRLWEYAEGDRVAKRAPVWLLSAVEPQDRAAKLLRRRRKESIADVVAGLREGTMRWEFDTAVTVGALLGAHELVPSLIEGIRGGGYRGYKIVRALGTFGSAAAPAIAVGLAHEDWWMVLVSAEMMAALRPAADSARPVLRSVAEGHWSPGVRAFASKVLRALDEPGTAAPRLADSPLDHGYRSCVPKYGYIRILEDDEELQVPRDPVWRFTHGGVDEERELRDWPDVEAPEAFPSVCVRSANPATKLIELPRDMTTMHTVSDGWLAVSNMGEFGGVVVFVASDGTGYEIASAKPYQALVEDSVGLLGIFGFCHLGCDRGGVHRLERRGGRWHASRPTTLPAAPRGVWIEPDRAVLIATEAGVVKLRRGGSFDFLGCR